MFFSNSKSERETDAKLKNSWNGRRGNIIAREVSDRAPFLLLLPPNHFSRFLLHLFSLFPSTNNTPRPRASNSKRRLLFFIYKVIFSPLSLILNSIWLLLLFFVGYKTLLNILFWFFNLIQFFVFVGCVRHLLWIFYSGSIQKKGKGFLTN